MSILDKPVLVLNRSWQAVNTITVQGALSMMVPKSKGGATRWENVVLADKRINSIRGNLTLEEADLKLNRTFQPENPLRVHHDSLNGVPKTFSVTAAKLCPLD
jgi:5-methylcytosine-specific restriction endonuclease McrA